MFHTDHESLKHLWGDKLKVLTSLSAKLLGYEYVKDMYTNDLDFFNIYESCNKKGL